MLINVEGEKERIPRSGQVERSLDSALSKGREREDCQEGSKARSRSLARSLATLAALPFEPRFVMVRMIDEGSGSLHRRHVALRASPPIYTVSSLYTHRGRTPCAIPSFLPSFASRRKPQTEPQGEITDMPLSRSANTLVPILHLLSVQRTIAGNLNEDIYIYIYMELLRNRATISFQVAER